MQNKIGQDNTRIRSRPTCFHLRPVPLRVGWDECLKNPTLLSFHFGFGCRPSLDKPINVFKLDLKI